MKNILKRLPALDFRNACKREDSTILRFLENILTECYRIQHLVAGHEFPVAWILNSVSVKYLQ